ncbi:hypothetical protein B0H16DRAFT_831246 [Mycena metata]|uniref:Uncharacterized protein n=1 Tax=Mycena metata TaxID=1033252 RepID=A0AAD7N9X5_9AGAR|nr:hypothetical protein B0H16DRAFT_831246 [Mycena metata]
MSRIFSCAALNIANLTPSLVVCPKPHAMAPGILEQLSASIDDMHTICHNAEHMEEYRPLVVSVEEIRVYAATTYTVKKTAALINTAITLPRSSALALRMRDYQRALKLIRQHIEESTNCATRSFFFVIPFLHKARRLKAGLNHSYNVILASGKHANTWGVPPGESIREIAAFAAKVAAVVCDAPVLGIVTPILGTVTLICETAETVHSNRQAARFLAHRTNILVEFVITPGLTLLLESQPGRGKALLGELQRAVDDIHGFLEVLRHRGRAPSWIFAQRDRKQFKELNKTLSDLMVLLNMNQTIELVGLVRAWSNRTESSDAETGTFVSDSLSSHLPADGLLLVFRVTFVRETDMRATSIALSLLSPSSRVRGMINIASVFQVRLKGFFSFP